MHIRHGKVLAENEASKASGDLSNNPSRKVLETDSRLTLVTVLTTWA
jgi:hypothetical protein